MGVLRGFCRLVDAVSEYTARVAIWGVLALVFILTWEVLLRSLFNMPTIWAHESTQYFFGFYFALGGGYCLKMGGMVRVDTVIRLFRPRTRAVIEGVGTRGADLHDGPGLDRCPGRLGLHHLQ